MDKLQELVNTLSEDDKREFRIFINRQKSKKQRKDLDLFELINNQTPVKIIQEKLYKTPNKVAYHTLRKRLLKHLTDFIVLKQIDSDTTATSSIAGLVSLATYLFKQKSEDFGWRTLEKAEQIAIENEHYELLNNIYHLQIDESNSEFSPDINTIYEKWKNNKQLVDENEKANIAYNFIKKELNNIRIKGEDKDLEKIITKLLKKYGINDLVYQRPHILYKVLDLTRRVMLSKKDFYNFEPYIIKTYEKLESSFGFSKRNHFYKINILYMISHILYRNRRFEESNKYLKEMLSGMNEYNKSYYQQFYPKYIMLQAANFTYLNKNEKSITLLSNVKENELKKMTTVEQFNIKINLVVYYFNQAEYKKANTIIQTLNHSDNWLEKKMGVEWVLKKNLIEIILQFELGNIDIVLNRIRSFELNFSNLFNHPLYKRVNLFVQTIKTTIDTPDIMQSQVFIENVKETLVRQDSEQEDLQAMAFYAWLKAKMMKLNYYDVLLDIANTKYEEL
ncbi:MAG: hypothetical protein COB15_10040 [Flavobacteriales bacterium]|nr:MAG: hypothetical protein COB15_10040 [Flavobacteriales bacterium]